MAARSLTYEAHYMAARSQYGGTLHCLGTLHCPYTALNAERPYPLESNYEHYYLHPHEFTKHMRSRNNFVTLYIFQPSIQNPQLFHGYKR